MKCLHYTISIALHNNKCPIVRLGAQLIGTIDVEMQQPDLAVQDQRPFSGPGTRYSWISTGVRTGTNSKSSTMSALCMRTQPCDPGLPMVAESGLPWI